MPCKGPVSAMLKAARMRKRKATKKRETRERAADRKAYRKRRPKSDK